MADFQRLFKYIVSKYNNVKGKSISVGTDCSGIEAPLMALDLLGVNYTHLFSSEIDKNCIDFIERNFAPKLPIYIDLKTRNVKDMPPVDLYIAGFPCQTFSSLGRNEGFDNNLKGTIFFYIYEYIFTKLPNMFILENVRTLTTHDKGNTFAVVMDNLKSIGKYNIYYDILNTKDYGIPQSRNRIFIVGIKKTKQKNKFQFPKPLTQSIPIKNILDNHEQEQPNSKHQQLMKDIVYKYPDLDFYNDLWILNLNVSSIAWFRKGEPYLSPCIVTNSKYYIPKYNRYLSAIETLKLQGVPWKHYNFDFQDNILYKFAGNTISVNVIAMILGNLLQSIH